MTLRELVACATPLVGSHTVREHMSAMTCDFIGGDITISGEFISLNEENSTLLINENTLQLNEIAMELLDEDDIILQNKEEGSLNGICSKKWKFTRISR